MVDDEDTYFTTDLDGNHGHMHLGRRLLGLVAVGPDAKTAVILSGGNADPGVLAETLTA